MTKQSKQDKKLFNFWEKEIPVGQTKKLRLKWFQNSLYVDLIEKKLSKIPEEAHSKTKWVEVTTEIAVLADGSSELNEFVERGLQGLIRLGNFKK